MCEFSFDFGAERVAFLWTTLKKQKLGQSIKQMHSSHFVSEAREGQKQCNLFRGVWNKRSLE